MSEKFVKIATDESDRRYRSDFKKRTKPWTVRNSLVSQDRVVCYHVAKIACIRPCGKVQLKSLVLTMRSDFITGGVCKVVGYYT